MSDSSRSRLANFALGCVLVGLVGGISAVFLTRFGVSDFRLGLVASAAFMLIVAVGVLLGVIGFVRGVLGRPGLASSVIAVVAGAAILFVPLVNAMNGGSVPMIHDITTDLEDPPTFVAVVALRGEDANALDRSTPDLNALQRTAYPQLQTLSVADDTTTVFNAVLEEIAAQGWELADAVEPQNGEPGRIEATDTTLLFGFKDDIVIRIADDGPDRTLVDMRSVSRVGESDLGVNAARIEAFLRALDARLQG